MKIDQNKFLTLLNDDVYKVLIEISRRGFCLTLVGGAVRDYLLNGELPFDLDFEIKHKFYFKEDEWKRKLDALFNHLGKHFSNIKIRELNYYIYRVSLGEFELEFSSPREEECQKSDDHNYFTPHFISNLDAKRAFYRRDLTINAIGIFFGVVGSHDEFSFVDPYNGREDLKEELLRAVSQDFFYDYVRFLRLVRFKTLFNFNISSELESDLGKFNLEKATNHYVFCEFKKCFHLENPLSFFSNLFFYIDKYNIKTNELIEVMRPLCELDIKDSKYKISDDFLGWLSTHKKLKQREKLEIVTHLNLSQKKLKRLLKEV